MSLRIEDYVGKKVRVIEVHPLDCNPAHKVGDVALVGPESEMYDADCVFPNYAVLNCLDGGATVCKFEPVEEPRDTVPPSATMPQPEMPQSDFAAALDVVLADVRAMLLAKNAAYGDSALRPVRAFSKASPLEAINVRIDDKLSRLMRGSDAGEDTARDLLGYLVLREVALKGGVK